MNDDQKHQDAADELDSSGNASISGTTPDPESDDDSLKAAQDMGLYKDQDEEHPGELGIDQEIRKDELKHQKED